MKHDDNDDGYLDRKERIDRLERRLKAAEGAWLKLAANLAAERDAGITKWRKLYQNLQQHHGEQMEMMRAKLQEQPKAQEPRADEALAALKQVHDLLAHPGRHGDSVQGLLSCILDSLASMQTDHAEALREVAHEQREATAKAVEALIDRRWPEVGDRPSSPPAVALDLLNVVVNVRLVTEPKRGQQAAVVQAPPVDEEAEARFEGLLRRGRDDRAGVVPAGDAAQK